MGTLLRRIWHLLRRRQFEDDIAEELEFHRAMAQATLEESGMPRERATEAARRVLGNDLSARDRSRDVWIWPWLQDLAQDLRFGARLVIKDYRFTATVVGVLGLGLGVSHLFLTLLYAHVLRGFPIEHADRVLWVRTFDDRRTDRALSYPELEDLRGAARNFVGLAAFSGAPVVLGDEDRAPERFDGAYLTGNAFALVGVQPLIGRSLAPDDDRPGAAPVLMIGYGVWQARYGGDSAIVGRSVLVNGQPWTVIGVAPAKSGFPSTAEVWLPLSQLPGLATQTRSAAMLNVFGRLRDGATLADGRGEIESIMERASREHPDTSKTVRARVTTINERFYGRLQGPWLAFMTAGLLVLLVTGANVANLMLTRIVQRSREIAVRSSLGASRNRVVRQLIAEAGVLAALGSGVGFMLAVAGLRLFEQAIPPNLLPYWLHYSLDLRIFAILVAASILTLLIFAVVPAMRASKTDVNLVLKEGGRAGMGRRGTSWWTAGFLTAQLALSTILLVQMALAFRADSPDLPSDLTLRQSDALTASLTLPSDRYPTAEARAHFYRRMTERVRTMPGVSLATIASVLPRRGGIERIVEVAGRPRAEGEPTPSVWTVAIAGDYLDTLGLTLVRGRSLVDDDGASGDVPAVVNERFVTRYLAGGEAIGQHITLHALPNAPKAEPLQLTIAGVAPDIKQRNTALPDPLVYVPLDTTAPADAVLIAQPRATGGIDAADLRKAALDLDASIPLYRMTTLSASIDETEWNSRTSIRLISLVTGVSILLAAVGLYAVMAYSVSERTQEIGLRMALGARGAQVGRMIFRRALIQVAFGLLFGIIGAVAWDRAFAVSDRSGIRLADPVALAAVGVLLSAIALIACIAPARRAMRLDPIIALRHE